MLRWMKLTNFLTVSSEVFSLESTRTGYYGTFFLFADTGEDSLMQANMGSWLKPRVDSHRISPRYHIYCTIMSYISNQIRAFPHVLIKGSLLSSQLATSKTSSQSTED